MTLIEQNKRLYERARTLYPSLSEDDVVALWEYNLDIEKPDGLCDGFVVVDNSTCRIYEAGQETHAVALSDVNEFRFFAGVGCVFVEYTLKNGESRLISRADCHHKNKLASAVKAVNGFMRYDEHAFHKHAPQELVCPKCGRAYRPGSQTCLSCFSKRKMIKRLWDVASPYKWYIFASMLIFVLTSAVSLIAPQISQNLTDNYILNEEPESVLLTGFLLVLGQILLVQLLQRAFSSFQKYFLLIAGNKVVHRLRNIVFEKIQRLSIARISKRTAGELMNRVSSDTSRIRMFVVNEMARLIEQIMLFIAVGIVIFAYDYRLAILIILPMPLIFVSFWLFRRMMGKLFRRSWERSSQSNTVLHDIFSGIRVVKSYGMEHREAKRFESFAAAEKETQLKIETKWAYINPILHFLMGFGEFFLLFYAGNAVLGNWGGDPMTLGEMAKFSTYASMIYAPLQFLAGFPRQFMMAMTSITKVFEIIDEPEDIADAKDAVDLKVEGSIDLENVSFGYDEAVDVLRHIDLHIKPGEFIGLVGKSGTGKSTLINLIMRMYDVDEGSLKIDGVDIKDISQQSLRSQIGVVLQETFLFNGSIFQNIAYAKPDASREDVIKAAKTAGAHSFIVKLTDGYDTWVGEKGCTLSGGEKQRIAIARALLHNPKILILDEATASLDTETEKQIQDSLAALSHERTTIAIAHRLSTLRNATRLVVLDRGKIAEIGTHEELIEKQGIYYNLVMAQREMSKMA